MDSDVHTDGENKQCGLLLYQIQAADHWQCRWAMKESSKNLISIAWTQTFIQMEKTSNVGRCCIKYKQQIVGNVDGR